jgi:hypothetical protein
MSTSESISRDSPVRSKGRTALKKFSKVLGISALTILRLFVILAIYVAEIDYNSSLL